jgi:dethiobiotin synthetase
MRIVIVGTGTEVGKTHVACALLHALSARGEDAIGLKPIETGVRGAPEDALRLGGIAPRHAFGDPVSPHLAARRAGVTIELDEVAGWVRAHSRKWQIIETAGGLLTPLALGITNLDLVHELAPAAVVVVAPDRLGTLHDVSAVLCVLGRPVPVCLSAPAHADASTGTNAAELGRLGIAEPIEFPRAPLDDAATQKAAALLLARCSAEETV